MGRLTIDGGLDSSCCRPRGFSKHHRLVQFLIESFPRDSPPGSHPQGP